MWSISITFFPEDEQNSWVGKKRLVGWAMLIGYVSALLVGFLLMGHIGLDQLGRTARDWLSWRF
jgi:hypothetical protein